MPQFQVNLHNGMFLEERMKMYFFIFGVSQQISCLNSHRPFYCIKLQLSFLNICEKITYEEGIDKLQCSSHLLVFLTTKPDQCVLDIFN